MPARARYYSEAEESLKEMEKGGDRTRSNEDTHRDIAAVAGFHVQIPQGGLCLFDSRSLLGVFGQDSSG